MFFVVDYFRSCVCVILLVVAFSTPEFFLLLITKDEKSPGEPWNMRRRDPSLW